MSNVKLCACSTIPLSIRAFYGEQLTSLIENGFEVHVLTSPDPAFAEWLPDGVTYHPVAMARRVTPLADLRALAQIIGVFRRNRFDLVQYNTPKAALCCSIAARLNRVPTRLYLMWGLYYTGQHGLRRALFKTFERVVCRNSTHIAPDGRETMAYAIEQGLCPADKIEVVGNGSANGIDLARFDPAGLRDSRRRLRDELEIGADDVVVGIVARLGREKGINELIHAFVRAREHDPRLVLLLVGPVEEGAGIEPEVLTEMRENPAIRSVGFQSEVERYLAAMDVFALPSWREGFGVVNLEAAAMELPVVSTDVMGPRESVLDGETGLLVPLRDADALRGAMLKLAGDPELRRRFGEAGRRRVEQEFEQRQHWGRILEHRRRIMAENEEKRK